MIPLALALIDSVFALALHHDERAKISLLSDHECASVWAAVSGPEPDGPIPGALLICVSIKLVPHDPSRPALDESVHVHLDLQDQRLLSRELSLSELPLDRSGLARMVGELEAWCYARIPVFRHGDVALDDVAHDHVTHDHVTHDHLAHDHDA